MPTSALSLIENWPLDTQFDLERAISLAGDVTEDDLLAIISADCAEKSSQSMPPLARYEELLPGCTLLLPNRGFPRPGARLNQYVLGQVIGRGATSLVYLAKDTSLNDRAVILKLSTDCDNELRLCSARIGTVMPQILETFRAETATAIVYEYFSRQTLRDAIAGRMSRQDKLHLATAIVSGIEELHLSKIAHGDLKPENILVSHNLRSIQLIDFNASFAVGGSIPNAVGTRPYLAPERMHETDDFSIPIGEDRYASDLYAFGIICFELFEIPLLGHNLSQFAARIPFQLRQLVLGCLSRQPVDRIRAFEKWKRAQTPTPVLGRVMTILAFISLATVAAAGMYLKAKEPPQPELNPVPDARTVAAVSAPDASECDYRILMREHQYIEARHCILQSPKRETVQAKMDLGVVAIAIIRKREYLEEELPQLQKEVAAGYWHAKQDSILGPKYERMMLQMETELEDRLNELQHQD